MQCPPLEYAHENYPLASSTLYRVGGPARIALVPRDHEEVQTAYAWMAAQSCPKIVLGGGSNVLIADDGFDGIVLFSTELTKIEALGDHRYRIEGGALLDDLVRDVIVENNYAGAGGLTGIPGSVGGAIYMNAGTVNGSICELMESVDLVTEKGIETVDMDASKYGYRRQTFCPPGALILNGNFRFEKAPDNQKEIYDHYMQRRREKQPQGASCGSVFKNPKTGEHAGQLIEACELKGTRRGDAVISTMHANFIVNEGEATCADILWLLALAKRSVYDKFGITLEEEVKIIGIAPLD